MSEPDAEPTITDEAGSEAVRETGARRATVRRRQRRVGWALLLVSVLVLGGVAWVGVTGLQSRRELTTVTRQLTVLRNQLAAGDFTAGLTTARSIARHAARAHDLTTGPPWAIGSSVPGVGSPLDTARGISSAVHQVAATVLPALVQAAQTLDSKDVRSADGTVDVKVISDLAASVRGALTSSQAIQRRVDALPAHTWLASVDSARSALATALDSLESAVFNLSAAASLAPSMLGDGGPRRYFVGFLNTAESRGVGGVPGAFGILLADHGHLTFTHFGSDDELKKITANVNFGADYAAAYGDYRSASVYYNSTVSPNFPYAAQIWASMWQKKSGEHIDGAIALDPRALSYLLGATGPTALSDGTAITAANIVGLTQSVAYTKFGDDQAARKAFLLTVATAADRKIFAGTGNELALVRAAVKAVGERRLLVWSADAGEEKVLAAGSVGGTIAPTDTPYAAVFVNNYDGSKLDYYLHVTLDWRRSGCGSTRTVTATITLRNAAPRTGLPEYVTQKPVGSPQAGDHVLDVAYLATGGAVANGVTVDGKAVTTTPGFELGHPTVRQLVTIPAGATRTVVVTLHEPAAVGSPQIVQQALVNPIAVTVADQRCR